MRARPLIRSLARVTRHSRAHVPLRFNTMPTLSVLTSKDFDMDMFNKAVAAAATPSKPKRITMQTVFDTTQDPTEQKRIRRIKEFFDAPLATFDEPDLLGWFDRHFPSLKALGANPMPGSDRHFWTSSTAYQKWREVVRRRICHATGINSTKQALRARNDGWAPLLGLLKELAKGPGPLHSASVGAITAFSDAAREAGLDPSDLTESVVPGLLEAMPLMDRDRAAQALRALARAQIFDEVAALLPADFDPTYLVPAPRTPVPDTVRKMIDQMVQNARLDESTYDDVSQTCSENFGEDTAETYTAALIALARTAQDLGCVDLDTLTCPEDLFCAGTRRAVVADWTTPKTDARQFSLRTAADYVGIIALIGNANRIDVSEWKANYKNNKKLNEGRAAGETMSPKVQRFCESLIAKPENVRIFLRQHILYQERAQDILATDKALALGQIRKARHFGTVAAFAALEIRGAGLRKGSALAAQSHGVNPNLFQRTNGKQRWYELRVAKEDMKGEYVQLPPINIRDDAFAGYEVLDWYLRKIRPLSDYANPEFCEQQKCPMSPYLFVAERSPKPLSGALLYRWLTSCSDKIGLKIHPHNFRHGFATLLLAKSWSNRGRAAAYLGCSVNVLETYYGWIDKRQKLEEVQDLLAEALAGK